MPWPAIKVELALPGGSSDRNSYSGSILVGPRTGELREGVIEPDVRVGVEYRENAERITCRTTRHAYICSESTGGGWKASVFYAPTKSRKELT